MVSKMILFLILFLITPFAHANPEPGVTKDYIRFRQIAVIDGAAQYLGRQMGLGIRAAFHNVKIQGKSLILESVNDGYEDLPAESLILETIKEGRVLGIIGGVGTPTARLMAPQAEARKMPFIGAFTGAALLRGDMRYIVNMRASYLQEAERLIDLAVASNKKKISILMQRDAFGEAVLNGVSLGLAKHDLTISSFGSFERNTMDILEGLKKALKSDPEVLVLVGPYKPIAETIRQIRTNPEFSPHKNITIMTVSFVGSDALLKELKDLGKGVIITQVVPNPVNKEHPIQKSYHKAISNFCALSENKTICAENNPINWVSMEGYLVGRMVVDGLENLKNKPITRENLLDSLFNLKRKCLGSGWSIDFQKSRQSFKDVHNQGSNFVLASTIIEKTPGHFTFEMIDKLS